MNKKNYTVQNHTNPRLPHWLKKKQKLTREVLELKKMLREKNLNTVCESAGCPNLVECFRKPTATFMILGNHCTRNCAYCGVAKGKPDKLDPDEPLHVAEVSKELGLKHVVITSVTRDDLPDGGAEHYVQTVQAIRNLLPEASVEVLIPDFMGSEDSLKLVLESGIKILNHNIETVPQLYSSIRPQADFQRSLMVLRKSKQIKPEVITKSGLMVGLGETDSQLYEVFHQLAAADCEALTIGQYLRPSIRSYPVQEYVPPDKFNIYKEQAQKAGIKWVFSAPLVRSSYNAEALIKEFNKIS